MRSKPVEASLYNDEYYMSKNHGYEEFLRGYKLLPQFEKFIFDNIKKTDKVLDIGCGRGEVIVRCAKKGIICFGVDYSKSAISICKEVLKNQKIRSDRAKVMNAKKLEFKDKQFDIVIMMDVVEHLHDWELAKALSEARRVLKPRGKILIHTSPNKNNMSVLRTIARVFNIKFASEEFHVNEQTPASLANVLKYNFSILSMKKVKDKQYFSNQVRRRGLLVRFVMALADFFFDSPLVDLAMKNDALSDWLSTDIYVVAKRKGI